MKMLLAGGACAAVLTLATPASVVYGAAQDGRDGPGSTIGVSISELRSEQAGKATVEGGGVLIERVHDGTPAARAGFKVGDVVVEFDGERVRSARQFVRLVQETRPNRPVKATVVRDGSRQTISVTPELGRAVDDPSTGIRALTERPFRFSEPLPSIDPKTFQDTPWSPQSIDPKTLQATPWFIRPQGRLGVSISPVGDQLAAYFGVKEGVLVESVDADSPAARAGLRAGDVIVEVGGRAVSGAAQVAEAISKAQPGSNVDLRIVREKQTLTLTATLPEKELFQFRPVQPIAAPRRAI